MKEDYIDLEVETSRFCDSDCNQSAGECTEIIGIQNKKRLVVKQRDRTLLTTRLEQVRVTENRCMECGCIRDTQIVPTGNYRTQRPVLEREQPTISSPNLDNASFEPAYRQSKRLEWKSAEDK